MLYYRFNDSFGDMLYSTHDIGGTRNMVVYACPHNNRMVCENGGNCYTGTGTTMIISYSLDEFTLFDDGMKGSGAF